MTWVKPSWAWMMYRAGYSHKDVRQARVLALRMTHERFLALLERGVLSHGGSSSISSSISSSTRDTARDKTDEVRVQWDPERTPGLERLPHRSIQIGIPAALSEQWADEWIVSIEDVTQTARNLKQRSRNMPICRWRRSWSVGLCRRGGRLPCQIAS